MGAKELFYEININHGLDKDESLTNTIIEL